MFVIPAPEPVITPDTYKEPVILAEVFTWNPKSGEIEAVVEPLAI